MDSLTSFQNMVSAYRETYPDDYFVYPAQIKETANAIVARYRHIGKEVLLECLKNVLSERMELNEDMCRPSGLKKYLKGVMFVKSHPNPFARPRICQENCQALINPHMNDKLLEIANAERVSKEGIAQLVKENKERIAKEEMEARVALMAKYQPAPPITVPEKSREGDTQCPKCMTSGAIYSFLKSEAGRGYLKCGQCGMNFQY